VAVEVATVAAAVVPDAKATAIDPVSASTIPTTRCTALLGDAAFLGAVAFLGDLGDLSDMAVPSPV
jgi:hypothetical protein